MADIELRKCGGVPGEERGLLPVEEHVLLAEPDPGAEQARQGPPLSDHDADGIQVGPHPQEISQSSIG